MRNSFRLSIVCIIAASVATGSIASAQKSARKPVRSKPPTFQSNEFSGVFFADPVDQLRGTPLLGANKPANISSSAVAGSTNATSGNGAMSDSASDTSGLPTGNAIWKSLISSATIEDLVKESKTRIDAVITTPAKFAGGGYADTRREFTLLASLMAVISQYPEEIRWQSSSVYARNIFARMAANCKVGTQQVFNEAKLRQQDLQNLLKGSKLTGTAEETSWADTADRNPAMQLLEWAQREQLAPATSSDKSFREGQEDIVKYAEFVAMMGQIIQQEGMTDADDAAYNQIAAAMVQAALDVAKAAKNNEADAARAAVGRIDQTCSKCHETYR